jgi:hypothetical protein
VPRLGRTFVGPVFDSLWIGGGITLPAALWLLADGRPAGEILGRSLPLLVLLVNQAHFAASTLRLYSKPGAVEAHPFLAHALPLVTLAVLSLCIAFSAELGRHLWALAMTWSPYHYAAQAFGLASMYCYRSGLPLGGFERGLLRWTCLMPFFRSLLGGAASGLGLGWLLPPQVLGEPAVASAVVLGVGLLDVLVFAMPAVFFVAASRRARAAADGERPRVPLLALFPVLANGLWFVPGLPALALVAIGPAREGRVPGRRAALARVGAFYAGCVGLGYALFQCWPVAYELAGFGMVESTFLVVAAVNIHHFVVDAYIWRLRRDPNYGTVMAASPA